MDSGILLARQAIYDSRLRVHAYELLFRSHNAETASFTDGDQATSAVLLNAFTSLPVADILEGKPAFVNFTRNLLESPPPIDSANLVVEVLEDIVIDADMIAAVRRLKKKGYTIALDDYVYAEGHHELIELADLIKIDVLAHSLPELQMLVTALQPYGAILLAEKVETLAMFETCKELGFKLFQGFFLSRPQLVKGRALKSDQRAVLQLLAALRIPDVDFRQIEKTIQTDSVLVYKLLRLVNSALYHQQREITSIRQALTLLGLEKIRSWGQLLALSNLDNKPAAVFTNAMIRARLGQLLAEHSPSREVLGENQFTIGLLSTLDAFLGMELEQILDSIAMSSEVKEAILQRRGISGFLLSVAIAYEQADFDAIDWDRLEQLGISAEAARDAYVDSIRWADENLKFLR